MGGSDPNSPLCLCMYWVPSSGTSVLAQPRRDIRKGRMLQKGKLCWKEEDGERGEQELPGDRIS